MAGSDDDPTVFQTSSAESQRQAEAAFGGAGPAQPVGVPGGNDSRRRLLRRLIVAFVLVDVVVGIGVGGYLLVKSAVDDNRNPSKPAIPAIPGVPSVPGVPEQPSTSQSEPPSAPADNFSAAGLRRTKATAQALSGRRARIQLARITQDQLQVISRNGSGGKVVIVSAAITRAIDTPAGTLTGNEFGFESFNPAVAARLARAIDRRYRIAPADLDYMVVIRDPIDKKIEWLVYPRGRAGHFQADSRGGSLRRVG